MLKAFNHRIHTTLLLAAALVIASCSKHYTPSRNEHKQYAVNNDIKPDSAIIYYYLPYKEKLDKEMNTVLGYTDVDLTKPAQPETLLGNFFVDALLSEARRLYPEIDFAIGTKGGLRTELAKGNITLRNLFELMPFENKLVVLHLSGEHTAELLNFIALKEGQPVAGLRMKIKDNKPTDVFIAGKAFDITKSYTVLTYDFLANGGDNITGLNNPIKRIDINKGLRDILIEHVTDITKNGNHINTQTDGRITYEK